MTVALSTRRSGPYTATAGQTVFDFTWPIKDAGDLVVTRLRSGAATVLAYPAAYTLVSGSLDNPSGGQISLVAGALAGDQILIEGDRDPVRLTAFADTRAIDGDNLNAEFDHLQLQLQELRRRLSRAVSIGDFAPGSPPAFPQPIAGRIIQWNETGTALENGLASAQSILDALEQAEAAVVAAEAARDAAQAAATTAAADAVDAVEALLLAHKNAAEAAEIAAEAARDAALAAASSATTQAGTATTKAGEALASANTAQTQATNADAARAAAEAARDAALVAQDIAQNSIARALILIDAGQSNDVGRAPQVTLVFPDKLRTFNGGPAQLVTGQPGFVNSLWARPATDFQSLVAYTVPEANKEAPPAGFALRDTYYQDIVAYGAAVGGFSWRNTNPGNGPFASASMAMSEGFKLLRAAGYRTQDIDCVIRWALGEADADQLSPASLPEAGTPRAEWAVVCNAALAVYRQQWRMVTGDPTKTIRLLASPCAITQGDTWRNVQNGILDVARAGSNEFICVGPRYGWPHEADGVHLTGVGFRLRAEYDALRLAQVRDNPALRLPLHVTGATWSGTTLTLTFNRACQIDTTTLSNTDTSVPNSLFGIEVFDGGTPVDIVSGSMTASNVFTGTTAAAAAGVKTGRLGQMTWVGTNPNRVNLPHPGNAMARTNFREPAALGSVTLSGVTYDLFSWCAQQELVLP